MATLFGPRICIITGKFLGLYLALCLLAAAAHAEIVQAENYDAFWLWAGVNSQPALGNAKEIYLLAGEIRGQKTPQIISQRGATPHLNGPTIWVVYRVQTLAWNDDVLNEVLAHVETWRTDRKSVV